MPTVLELYEKLKPKLGEEEARSLLEYVETSIEHRAATKADLQEVAAGLREQIHRVESGLRQDVERHRAATKADLQEAVASLKEEIHRVREHMQAMGVGLIKWSFAFWIGTIAALSGIVFTLLRTVGPR